MMVRTRFMGVWLAALVVAGCTAETPNDPALSRADLQDVDTTLQMAMDRLESAQGTTIDAAQRTDAIEAVHELLSSVPASSEAALTGQDLGDIPAGDIGGAGPSTSGSFGGGSGAAPGSFGRSGTTSGSFGGTAGTGGTFSGVDGARTGGFGAFAVACRSYGVLNALDLNDPNLPYEILSGFDCVVPGTAPLLRWSNIGGAAPYQLFTIAIDFQTVEQLANNPDAASSFLLAQAWGPVTTGATAITYSGPYLSAAGGFGILVGVVVSNDGSAAGLFIALIV